MQPRTRRAPAPPHRRWRSGGFARALLLGFALGAATEAPAAVPAPAVAEASAATETPAATEAPAVSPAPAATQAPAATPAPAPADPLATAAGETAAEVQARLELARELRQGQFDGLTGELGDLGRKILAFLPLLAVAVAILLLFLWLARLVGRADRAFRWVSHNRFAQDLARQGARSAVVLLGLLFALEILGATAVAGAVLGTAGVVGLALGFAFRDVVENYIAGVLMSLRQPFEPNDHVVIEGNEGKIIRLTSRATILMTLDGNHLRIPNADVFKGVMLNYSRNPKRRFSFAVGLGNDEDLSGALALGVETLSSIPEVLADPEPWVQIDDLGDSSVRLIFYGWVDQRVADFPRVRGEAIRRVKEELEARGMDLPEPIYRLRLERGPGAAAEGAEELLGKEAHDARAPAARGEEARSDRGPAPDLSADDTIDRQIAAERATEPSADLLQEAAPKE